MSSFSDDILNFFSQLFIRIVSHQAPQIYLFTEREDINEQLQSQQTTSRIDFKTGSEHSLESLISSAIICHDWNY